MAGYEISGGYGQIDPYIQMMQLLLQGRQLESQGYDQMGYMSQDAYNRLYGSGQQYPTFSRQQWTTGQTGYMPGGTQKTMSREQMEEANRQWQEQFDRSGTQWQSEFDRSGTQWNQNFGENQRQFNTGAMGYDENGRPTLSRQQMENQAGMQYLDLMTRMQQNPADYFQYKDTLRAGESTPMASFAQRIASGGPMSAFSAVGPSQANTMQSVIGQQSQLPAFQNANYQQGSWQAPTAQTYKPADATNVSFTPGGMTSQAKSIVDPTKTWGHQLGASQYGMMNSAERGLMDSSLKYQGYNPADFWGAFNRSRPRGQAAAGYRFRG
jgi:hypothetical protein